MAQPFKITVEEEDKSGNPFADLGLLSSLAGFPWFHGFVPDPDKFLELIGLPGDFCVLAKWTSANGHPCVPALYLAAGATKAGKLLRRSVRIGFSGAGSEGSGAGFFLDANDGPWRPSIPDLIHHYVAANLVFKPRRDVSLTLTLPINRPNFDARVKDLIIPEPNRPPPKYRTRGDDEREKRQRCFDGEYGVGSPRNPSTPAFLKFSPWNATAGGKPIPALAYAAKVKEHLWQLHHPNLVRILAAFANPSPIDPELNKYKKGHVAPTLPENSSFCIVMDLLLGTQGKTRPTVLDLLNRGSGKLTDAERRETRRLSEAEKLRICREVACGMAFLETRGIIHADLGVHNVFWDTSRLQIADAGLAQLAPSDDEEHELPVRTAPEVVESGIVGAKSDVWDFGLLARAVYTRDYRWPAPFAPRPGRRDGKRETTNGGDRYAIDRLVSTGSIHPDAPPAAPRRLQKVLEHCWDRHPCARPSFAKLYKVIAKITAPVPVPPEPKPKFGAKRKEAQCQSNKEGPSTTRRPKDAAPQSQAHSAKSQIQTQCK